MSKQRKHPRGYRGSVEKSARTKDELKLQNKFAAEPRRSLAQLELFVRANDEDHKSDVLPNLAKGIDRASTARINDALDAAAQQAELDDASDNDSPKQTGNRK